MVKGMMKPYYSLTDVKRIIKNTPKKVYLVSRKINNLALLGLNLKGALDIITNKLTEGHFHDLSPQTGNSFADVYLITVNKICIYIKLKISDDEDSLIIISFHENRKI